jgi:hypothetical protein
MVSKDWSHAVVKMTRVQGQSFENLGRSIGSPGCTLLEQCCVVPSSEISSRYEVTHPMEF